jgi:hypothetical protein
VLFAAAGWDGGLSARGKQILPSSRPRAKVTAQVCCLGVTVQASTRSPYQVGGVVIGRCELGAIGSADWSWPDIRGEAGGHPRGLG